MNTILTPSIRGYFIQETVRGYEVTRTDDGTGIEIYRTFRGAKRGLAIAVASRHQTSSKDYRWSAYKSYRDGVLAALEGVSDDYIIQQYRQQQRRQYGVSPAPAL